MRKPRLFNHEGYACPTEYNAEMLEIEKERRKREERRKYRPMVYICSPFAGDVPRNIRNARRYSRFAVMKGNIPIAPHGTQFAGSHR